MHSPWPSVIEMVGHSGNFDYVEYVAEYAPHDLHTMDNIGRAIDLFADFSGMIKIESGPSEWLASRAIGAGIQNVLFADIRTVSDVRSRVRSVRPDTPEDGGEHGVNMRRYVRFGMDAGTAEFVAAMKGAVVAVMIEKRQALDDLEGILTVPGVDMVQFGPADFALSIGKPGRYDDPEVVAAEQRVIETALALGKHPRVELGSTDGAERYLDMGVRHFCVGTDVSILMQWFRRDGAEMRRLLEST
ncbi:MAG: HpcH/HpaI aldolase family protein [Acidimicrobiia bacterium]